ncbi:MAG: 3-isopropylmalate dehydrogenase [Chitinophagaceae bacterium]|nr:3-isopropylmalate dehydrogenase [Chitinophagaceae bacterium]
MVKKITLIYGDGIGPEVTKQSVRVLDAIAETFNHEFIYERALLGAEAIDATGEALPQQTIDSALSADAVLFGAVGHPKYDNDPNAKVRPEQGILSIRKALQLYANVRPVKAYSNLAHLSPLKPKLLEKVDFIIYRELTGGIYFGEKETATDNSWAKDTCIYTRTEIERITHLAYKAAMTRKGKLTLVDKANVLDSSRLWRKAVQEIAAAYPDVKTDFLFVDNAAMQLILNPSQFDVILTENMFGDILSDEGSVLSGSIGLLPSASIGDKAALFEPIHGSYPQAAGQDIANPIGSILSAALMLDHFGLHTEADVVREAVDWTLINGFVTKDIDPVNFYFTSTVGDLISDYVSGKIPGGVNRTNIEYRKSTII